MQRGKGVSSLKVMKSLLKKIPFGAEGVPQVNVGQFLQRSRTDFVLTVDPFNGHSLGRVEKMKYDETTKKEHYAKQKDTIFNKLYDRKMRLH